LRASCLMMEALDCIGIFILFDGLIVEFDLV
jgi:hypothetical protein